MTKQREILSKGLSYLWSLQVSNLQYQHLTYWFIACGYHLTDERIEQLNKYLDDKGATIVDLATL